MGEEQVGDELDVDGPVSWVVEYEDGVDFEAVFHLAVGSLGVPDRVWERVDFLLAVEFGKRIKGEHLRVCAEDIARGDDRLEAVAFGNTASLGCVRAEDEYGGVS